MARKPFRQISQATYRKRYHRPKTFHYPRGLIEDAQAYANRRAARERHTVYVYARGGIVFVRAEGEPQPEGSEVIYATTR